MKYDRAIEKRDFVKIDKLNMLINTETFWDCVREWTKGITSVHSLNRWQCLAEYRYEEISHIWNKIKGVEKIIVRCNREFDGLCRNHMSRVKIGNKDDVLIIHFNKDHTYCRINDANTLFYIIDKVCVNSIIRAIDKGVLEEIKDYKEPKVIEYSIDELNEFVSR